MYPVFMLIVLWFVWVLGYRSR